MPALTDLTQHPVGYAVLAIFILAYIVVMTEEFTGLRKSKPVVFAAGIVWMILGAYYVSSGDTHSAAHAFREHLLDFGELMLFLLCAMTYINAMTDRRVFDVLRARLVHQGYSYRQLFWITGILAFFISSVADNLTTALIFCAVLLAVGKDNSRFIGLGCINIVVAANAGGAFTPFGDITTLMVWQKGAVDFAGFFHLFVPAAVNFLVPAACMHAALPSGCPEQTQETVTLAPGAYGIVVLFALTIATAVATHNFLHLPPVLGMMTGLAYLKLYSFHIHRRAQQQGSTFDIFDSIARAEWDTLLFFYGVVMCVGALGFAGYLTLASNYLYHDLGATTANVSIGILSAVIDNIPLMFAVLNMNPDLSQGQWLLITLTTGVGGSLFSIGSAAGVALMGQARGHYTFFTHLKWTWAIALGYAASIATHFWINTGLF